MAAIATELCLIGILNVWTDNPSVAWAQAILTLVWTVTFQLSAGQLGKRVPDRSHVMLHILTNHMSLQAGHFPPNLD